MSTEKYPEHKKRTLLLSDRISQGSVKSIMVKILEGRVVKIEIKDKGCGISDIRQARQPLFTTDAAGGC